MNNINLRTLSGNNKNLQGTCVYESGYVYLDMTKNDIIKEIISSLSNLNVNKIILFGSWAKENQGIESDIDLLVVTNDNFIFQSFAQKNETKLKYVKALHPLRKFADIDLIVHTKPMFRKFIELNSGFKKDIINTGTVIYESNN